MPRPRTCPSNASKHPGQIVLDANQTQCPREVVAAEKSQKAAGKAAKAAALKDTHRQIAAKEDIMAIEQCAQLTGPGQLIRPKPHLLAKKTTKMTLDTENAVYTSMTLGPKASDGAGATQVVNVEKRKSQDPRPIKFKDSVNVNRKSITEPSEETIVRKWAKIVPSKSWSQPSMSQSTQSADNELEWEEDVDVPEEFDDQIIRDQARAATVKDAHKGKKRTFFNFLDEEQEGNSLDEEEAKVEDNPDADYEGSEVEDVVNIDDDVEMIDQQLPEVNTKMSVDITELDEKPIKTKSAHHTSMLATTQGKSINPKKVKPRNAHLPSDAQNSPKWCSKFLPAVMYWVGNSNYPWTIPDKKLSDVCHDIFHEVFNGAPGEFKVDSYSSGFHMVYQRISEWRGFFGSTAVNVLITFFTSNDNLKTPNAQKEYAGDQLVDSCFMYEDPDNEDLPGAFLSEFVLRVFTAHLNAIYGYKKIDSIEHGLPGHRTLLALATAAAKHALILACDDLILLDNASDNGKKNYKIALTLNQTTNKMSNTGTTFSSGNWEMDTIAYMELIDGLSSVHISKIVA
ncbi:hypothetical protein BDR06DRAFT_1064338 [Suillus hirtellus]|nr:hypothetical protein BDR06DRAFT_1064338 [Suillus hirtellus]